MRVGLSTTTTEPGLTGGRMDGIGVYSKALLAALPAAGVAPQPYSFGPAAALSVGQRMPLSFPRATLRDLATPGFVRQHMDVDLFHATDYRIIRMGRPVVATLHDALPIAYPEWCNPKQRALKNWLQIKAARKADHVIAVSQFAVAELVQCFGVDETRISVVHNGVDEEWLQPTAPAAVDATLARHGLRQGYYLFVGTLQPRKNVERILQAYLGLPAAIRSARALLVVGAPGWRSEDLQRQLRAAAERGENVRWLERVIDQEELRQLYAGAGALVFPSLYEGFGIPVVEAFASRVPVIAANSTSLPEVCGGAALEVDPRSVPAIGAAMLDIVRDDALRARCIASGQLRAMQLTWGATASKTADVYRTILKQ